VNNLPLVNYDADQLSYKERNVGRDCGSARPRKGLVQRFARFKPEFRKPIVGGVGKLLTIDEIHSVAP